MDENNKPVEAAPPAQLTAVKIFWAVFWALWAFSLSAGLVYAIVYIFTELMAPIPPH